MYLRLYEGYITEEKVNSSKLLYFPPHLVGKLASRKSTNCCVSASALAPRPFKCSLRERRARFMSPCRPARPILRHPRTPRPPATRLQPSPAEQRCLCPSQVRECFGRCPDNIVLQERDQLEVDVGEAQGEGVNGHLSIHDVSGPRFHRQILNGRLALQFDCWLCGVEARGSSTSRSWQLGALASVPGAGSSLHPAP